MYKIKKKPTAQKLPILYNVIEDYTEFDEPGNVTVCAMTEKEDLAGHAKVLSESYSVPMEAMRQLLVDGGVYMYPQEGGLVTKGLFVCRVDPTSAVPKQTWVLDLLQFAEAEQIARARGFSLEDAAAYVFQKTLPDELKKKLQQKNLGLDYRALDRTVARGGDIKYIDFRKDWSPHFKRLCIMPDGRLVETGGVKEFAQLHGITSAQAKRLVEQGGMLEVNGEILACQIVNGQPAVARFNMENSVKAKELVATKGLHIMDALSEVGYNDPEMMRELMQKERSARP